MKDQLLLGLPGMAPGAPAPPPPEPEAVGLTRITSLYAPPDVDAANDAWRANCAPCALAAVLGRPVMSVRAGFPWFPAKPSTSPTALVDACARLGVRAELRNAGGTRSLLERRADAAIAIVQFTGPWTAPGASVAWAYRQIHMVGLRGNAAYDVNVGWWTLAEEWGPRVAPVIAREYPRADGGWWVRYFVELDVRPVPDARG